MTGISQGIIFFLIRSIAVVCEIVFAFIMMDGFLQPRLHTRWQRGICAVIMSLLMFATNGQTSLTAFHLPIEVILVFAITLFLYHGKLRLKIIYNLIFFVMLGLSVIMSSILINRLPKNIPIVVNDSSFITIMNIILPEIILFVLVGLLLLFSNKKKQNFAAKYWLVLLCVPLTTLLVLSVFQYCMDSIPADAHLFDAEFTFTLDGQDYKFPMLGLYGFIAISIVGLIFINILVFILFGRLHNQMEAQARIEALEQQTRLQSRSVEKLENSYTKMRELRHDLQNHLVCLNALVEKQKYDELKDYIKTMVNTVDEAAFMTITGNSTIDAILNEKLLAANKNEINTYFDVPPISDLRVEAMDLCIILSNILDNAVEACCKIPEGKERFIKLKIAVQSSYISVSCSNSTINENSKKNADFETDKADKELHGLGLKSIKNTAAKYGGEHMTRCKDGVFTIIVKLNA